MGFVEVVVVMVAVMAVVVWFIGRRHTLGSVGRTPGAARDSRGAGASATDSAGAWFVFDAGTSSSASTTSNDVCGPQSGEAGGSDGGGCDGGGDGGGGGD